MLGGRLVQGSRIKPKEAARTRASIRNSDNSALAWCFGCHTLTLHDKRHPRGAAEEFCVWHHQSWSRESIGVAERSDAQFLLKLSLQRISVLLLGLSHCWERPRKRKDLKSGLLKHCLRCLVCVTSVELIAVSSRLVYSISTSVPVQISLFEEKLVVQLSDVPGDPDLLPTLFALRRTEKMLYPEGLPRCFASCLSVRK